MSAQWKEIMLVINFLFIPTVWCLYEDQMGLFDWKQDFVGKVEYLHWDQSPAAMGKRLFVGTEKNVVASINAYNGSLAWRRVFEESVRGRVDRLLYQTNILISVLAGGRFVRSWQMGTSLLLWETSLLADDSIRASAVFTSREKADSFLVVTAHALYNIKTNDGKKIWETNLPKSFMHHILAMSGKIQCWCENCGGSKNLIRRTIDMHVRRDQNNGIYTAWQEQFVATDYLNKEEDFTKNNANNLAAVCMSVVPFGSLKRVREQVSHLRLMPLLKPDATKFISSLEEKTLEEYIKSDTANRWFIGVNEDDTYALVGVTPETDVVMATVNQEGTVISQNSVPAPWINDDTSCQIVKGSYFVCYVPSKQALQMLRLSGGKNFISTSLRDLGFEATSETSIEIPSTGVTGFETEVILRVSRNHMSVLTIEGNSLKIVKNMPQVSAVQIVENEDTSYIITLQKSLKEPSVSITGYELKSGQESAELSQKIPFANSHGLPLKVNVMMFTRRRDSKIGCKVAILSEDDALQVIQKPGRVSWRREEALADILAIEMVDLPVSENQAKFEDEFGSHDDVFVMFIKRLKAQLSQLQSFVIKMVERLQGLRHPAPTLSDEDIDQEEEEVEEEEDLIRDEFNLHKVIVAVTKAGKIFGIRSQTGKIVWQHYLPDLSPFDKYNRQTMLLFVQRTTAHFPNPPQCAILGKNKRTGNALIFTINPALGVTIAGTPPNGLDLGYKVVQASLLNEVDEHFLKGIILMDTQGKIHVYPESVQISSSLPSLYLHLTDLDTNIITGYRIVNTNDKGLKADEVWNINLQKSQQTITQVVCKRAIEHVHSQGRVLGDRSVLYKYLNPNLMAVVAEGEEPPSPGTHKGPSKFFSIYLVDGVTGHIVFHVNHKRCHGPINTVHSENWVVYSYFSEKHRRHEIAVLEMFEGKEQSNSTAFSSLSPPPQPLVLRQSYIFSSPLSAMATTVTEKGLTNKNIIISLKFGGLLSLPKALLDPRRPAMPSQESMEEGVIPYIPEIPIHTEAIINYNRTLNRVDGIYTGPAGLESTSLILTYGLDMFYTRVMPSKMFDVLKEDFDYVLIGSILFIMILVSILTQKLAAKRALSRAWK